MARISGIDLPKNKRVEIAVTYIYGIGNSTAKKLVEATGIDRSKRVHELTDEEVNKVRSYIEENLQVEGELRKDINLSIKRLMDLGNYRGLRHRRNLPARGQRTKTNARTRKGPRRVAVGKKKK